MGSTGEEYRRENCPDKGYTLCVFNKNISKDRIRQAKGRVKSQLSYTFSVPQSTDRPWRSFFS
jgi:hypothetical protein